MSEKNENSTNSADFFEADNKYQRHKLCINHNICGSKGNLNGKGKFHYVIDSCPFKNNSDKSKN